MLPRKRAISALFSAALSLSVLSGCSDSSDSSGDGADPAEVLAEAQATLEETSGVTLSLTTDDLPDGVTGVESATGVGTHAPAFDGKLTVVLAGQAFEVPVVAVEGKVFAQLPLTTGWQDVDPGEYGAPDPAQLMSPETGFSSLLSATTDLEQGESVRGGEGNKEVLTEFTGSVDGETMTNIIPTASGDFDVAYTITDDHELRSMELSGVFYPDSESMTYTVTFDDYGTEKDITAP